jgi:hypothetical protein
MECIPHGFEIIINEEPWQKITMEQVRQDKEQMKFGASYGVSRKVVGNKVLWMAKLPASQSITGKSVKLGMFTSSDDASNAVRYALMNPGHYHEETQITKEVPKSEVLEASYCERVGVMNRSNRDKLARKTKSLAKKEIQRNSQVSDGESFVLVIDEAFEELRRLKSWSRFARKLEETVSEVMVQYFPRNGDIEVSNNRQGASEFIRDVLSTMWKTENDGRSEEEFYVSCVNDFVCLTMDEDKKKYGSWVEDKVYGSL